MCSRNETVVKGLFVGEVAPFSDLHGIDLANQIGDGHVRSRKLLPEALLAADPADRERVALRLETATARPADRSERVVVDFTSLDRRNQLVEQPHEPTDDPALGLPALAEKYHVVAREHGVLDLRENGLVVADDSGHDRVVVAQASDEISPNLFTNGKNSHSVSPEFAQGQLTAHRGVEYRGDDLPRQPGIQTPPKEPASPTPSVVDQDTVRMDRSESQCGSPRAAVARESVS